eukprot:1156566-Pelagomonas_calceolata.AAC.6
MPDLGQAVASHHEYFLLQALWERCARLWASCHLTPQAFFATLVMKKCARPWASCVLTPRAVTATHVVRSVPDHAQAVTSHHENAL